MWFDNVARVEIEQFPSREAALEAERDAIKRERPEYNIVHNKTRRQGRVARRMTRDRFVFFGEREPITEASCSYLSPANRRKAMATKDPILKDIRGPCAIVGPALIYQGNTISVMVAHGTYGKPGKLTEVVLGEYFTDLSEFEWARACDTVIAIKRPRELTMDDARARRADIIGILKRGLHSVDVCETDISLALANASAFPSAQSRRILEDVSIEMDRQP